MRNNVKRLPFVGSLYRLSKKVRSPLGPLCEGAPPAGGGGENCTAVRNISGYGKALSLRPFGAPPSQREVFRRSEKAPFCGEPLHFMAGAKWLHRGRCLVLPGSISRFLQGVRCGGLALDKTTAVTPPTVLLMCGAQVSEPLTESPKQSWSIIFPHLFANCPRLAGRCKHRPLQRDYNTVGAHSVRPGSLAVMLGPTGEHCSPLQCGI